MPQLDPTSFSSQLFWLAVSFVLMYLLLSRIFLPRVQSVLAQRAGTIENDVAQAARMTSEAERALEQYEKSLADARAQSQAMLASAQGEVSARGAKRQAELEEAIEKKYVESDNLILAAKQRVTDKLTPVAGELASLIVETLIHQKPDAKAIGAVVDGLAKQRGL